MNNANPFTFQPEATASEHHHKRLFRKRYLKGFVHLLFSTFPTAAHWHIHETTSSFAHHFSVLLTNCFCSQLFQILSSRPPRYLLSETPNFVDHWT